MSFLRSASDLIIRSYQLARPYGRKKLAAVGFLSFAQGVFQVLGVTSIFPFLSLAASPDRLRDSNFGRKFLSWFPPMEDSQLLLITGLFAVGMLLLANLTNILGEYVRNRYAKRFAHWLRLRLIEQIAARPYADFLQSNSGILIKKVQGDVAHFANGILLTQLDVFSRLVTAILLLVTLFLVHPQIATSAALGLALFYAIFYFSLRRWRINASITLKRCGREAYKDIQQLFGGIKPVKIHRAESHFISRYTVHSDRISRIAAWIPVIGNTPRYLIEPIVFGGLVIAVLTFVGRGQDLAAILPNLGVMALAGYRLLPAIQLLYSQLSNLSTSRHALDEVYDEFIAVETTTDREDAGTEGRFPSPAAIQWQREIRLDCVTFKYPSADRPVIDNLSLAVPKNASLGIVGHTGSGKSTLVDLILGLHVPTSGHIFIDDTMLIPSNRRAWRASIGYVPQDIFLLDDTITANIAFGVPEDEIDPHAVRRAAAAAQILDFVENDLPNRFDTFVGERGVRLSGGQRQRIGLARALYHNPELLILDEATSALDNATEAEVMKAINALQGSVTLIIIAHRISSIDNCEFKLDLDQPERVLTTS